MRQKLIDLMNFGADIEISVGERQFTILGWIDEGILISEKGTEVEEIFPTPEKLLEEYLIDDVPLALVLDRAKIDFST